MTNEISMCQNFEVNRIKEIATKLERKLFLLSFVSFYFFLLEMKKFECRPNHKRRFVGEESLAAKNYFEKKSTKTHFQRKRKETLAIGVHTRYL